MHIIDTSEFIPKGNIQHNSTYNAPALSGDLIVRMTEAEIGRVNDVLLSKSGLVEYTDRSAHSQAMIESIVGIEEGIPESGDRYAFPMEIISLRDEPWLSTISAMQRIKVGRLLLLDNTSPFTADQVRQAQEDLELYLPNSARIDDESGIVRVPIRHSIEYDLDEERLSEEVHRRYVLQHGRRGLRQYQGTRRFVEEDATLGSKEALVSGIAVSTGPHNILLRRDLNHDVRHLGAILLDEDRSTGLRDGKVREVEVVNLGEEEIRRKDIAVDFRVYPGSTPAQSTFARRTSLGKNRIHQEGTVFSDILPLQEKKMRRWFGSLSSTPKAGKNAATVVSLDGITPVPWRRHYQWQKNAINTAVLEGERVPSHDHIALSKTLDRTSANGRMLITHNLPSASHLEELYKDGVRTFLFRGMRMPKDSFEGMPEKRPWHNFYMDQGLHMKLMELEGQGAEFIWWPSTIHGAQDPRVFYKNFFVNPDHRDHFDRFRQNGLGIAMFGTSKREAEGVFQDKANAFGAELPSVLNNDTTIAIMDGNGPGWMKVARNMAALHGYLRVSFGMDFEQVGEIPDFSSEVLVFFKGDQIEYRQTFLEYMHTIPVVNVGGDGTDYERVLAKLKVSLANSLPLPMYWVDGRDNCDPHFYSGSLQQMKQMVSGSDQLPPVSRGWVANLITLADNYDQVLEHMAQDLPCLDKFWAKAGVPEQTIHTAYANHVDLCKKVDITLPSFIAEAYERYCYTHS